MPKKIILVRHGETQDNLERRFQGWNDTPLNLTGHEQAQAVARRLVREKIDVIYTSDLLRAVQTAEHIASAVRKRLNKTFALREHDMGIFAGWQWEVEKDEYKQKIWEAMQHAITTKDIDWKEHGGESVREQGKRVGKFLRQLELLHKESTIVIVAHGGSLNRVMEHYRFKIVSEGYLTYKNTAVSIIEKMDGAYQLLLDNDISHLTKP